jgi:hypothetical protein
LAGTQKKTTEESQEEISHFAERGLLVLCSISHAVASAGKPGRALVR